MKLIPIMVVIALLFVVQIVQAQDIGALAELIPDHGKYAIAADLSLDGKILGMASWELWSIHGEYLEGDLWEISPLAGGLSYPLIRGSTQQRYVGVGYDGSRRSDGDEWYSGLLVYFGNPVEF